MAEKKKRVNQCRELLKAAEPLLAAALAPAGLTLEKPWPRTKLSPPRPDA